MEYKFQEYVINSKIPFEVILRRAGISLNYQGNLYCPFHDNEVTPAAKLYRNEDGDCIFCFSERRIYRPADAIKRGIIKANMGVIFQRLWSRLSEAEKNRLQVDYGKPVNIFPEGWEIISRQDNWSIQPSTITVVNPMEMVLSSRLFFINVTTYLASPGMDLSENNTESLIISFNLN